MKCKILTPTVTIFNDDGRLDKEGNKEVINFLIENGVDGLVPLGSTGEFTELSIEEKKELIKLYIDTNDNRVEIIAGTSSIIFDECVELSNYAIKEGADGVMILPPYYFGISNEEVYDWYERLAENISGNIYIYNFPARTGYDICPDVVLELARKHKNIKGLKDSTSNMVHTTDIIYKVVSERPDFEVYSGYDNHFIPNVFAGGSGCIAAISNFEPELWRNWTKAVRNENFIEIVEIQNKIDSLMKLYNIKSNFSLLFKRFLKDDGLNISIKSIFPFNKISDDEYARGKSIRDSIQ